MFQVMLHRKKQGDKEQEHDQHTVASFILLALQAQVFPIDKNGDDDKYDEERHAENDLPS